MTYQKPNEVSFIRNRDNDEFTFLTVQDAKKYFTDKVVDKMENEDGCSFDALFQFWIEEQSIEIKELQETADSDNYDYQTCHLQ